MTDNNNMKTHIYALIAEILNAETLTKAKLSILSRDILPYVMKARDIASVNRLVEVLTPMNKLTFIMFAKAMLPWKQEKDEETGKHVRFGKMDGSAKRVAMSQSRINDFIADPDANIWTWAKDSVELKAVKAGSSSKKKDLAGAITKAVQKGIEGHKDTETESLSLEDIVSAVILGGVDMGQILMSIQHMEDDKQDAEARAVVKAAAIKKAAEDRALLAASAINDAAIIKANYEPAH